MIASRNSTRLAALAEGENHEPGSTVYQDKCTRETFGRSLRLCHKSAPQKEDIFSSRLR